MKKYVQKTSVPRPAKNYKECMARICDLCGLEVKGKDWKVAKWADTLNETEIKMTVLQKRGYSYSDGGSGTQYEIDLCPSCFKNRLIPWLRSQGAKIEEEEWDW